MKSCYLVFVGLMLHFSLFGDNVKETLEKVPLSQLPFACIKTVKFIRPVITYPVQINTYFPLNTYDDLGLTQKYDDSNTLCDVFRRFKLSFGNYELVAIDVNIFDRTKRVLVTYQDGQFVDYIEVGVTWWPDEGVFIKQWRITSDEEVIVTWLKVQSATPIDPFGDFTSVNAQRIDTHYRIDEYGKFQLIKEVKYKPESYAKSYLIDKTKNLWEGTETPLSE